MRLIPTRWPPGLAVAATPLALPLLLSLIGCSGPEPSGEPAEVAASTEEPATVGAVEPVTGEWPQWRGPQRDGHAAGRLPSDLPVSLDLVWRVPIGAGYSSPLVSDGRVFVHERDAAPVGAPEGSVGTERLRALALDDGTQLWSSEPVDAPFAQNQYATSQGAGPFSTPAVDAERGLVYSLGVNANLEGRDVATGALRCRLEPPVPDTSKLFTGTAMSPLILEDGTVVVHLGDDRGGRLLAFDCDSQEPRWAWEGEGPGYASPMLLEADGVKQVVTLTDRSLVGVEVGTGSLLWRVDFADEWNENIVTPTLFDGTVLVSGVRRGSVALRPTLEDGAWSAPVVWERPERTHYMNSPVLLKGAGSPVWLGLSNKRKGQLVAMDPESGRDVWEGQGRFAESASLVAIGADVLALTVDGELVVLRWNPAVTTADGTNRDATLAEIARYTVADEAVWPHLAVAGDLILVRSTGNLQAWRLAAAG